MPYVVKSSKDGRFAIINQKTKQVVGTSNTLAKANRSIGYRVAAESGTPDTNIRRYTRKVDNKLPYFGETDLKKKTSTINKAKGKDKPGQVLDSIVHEKTHIEHQKMKEKTVREVTARKTAKMSPKQKQKHYSLFRG